MFKDKPDVTIIQGGADGVDAIAKEFAKEYEIPYVTFPALWNVYGPSAGPIRNKQMIDEGDPTCVIAFMTGAGPGTRNMVRQAIENNIPVIQLPG